jgi:hypothetical protein
MSGRGCRFRLLPAIGRHRVPSQIVGDVVVRFAIPKRIIIASRTGSATPEIVAV